jgi:hypothetical protein
VRGLRVLVDSDLAALYGVPTKRFNQAVKRNSAKFPAEFMFQLISCALSSGYATRQTTDRFRHAVGEKARLTAVRRRRRQVDAEHRRCDVWGVIPPLKPRMAAD